MTEDSVAVVRRFIEAVNRGDVDGAAELLSEDCEVNLSGSRGTFSGVYRGREQAREIFNNFIEAWETLRWEELEETTELDDERVLSVTWMSMRGHGSGVDVSAEGASIWTVRGGEIAGLTLYQSKDEAVEAAGLLKG